MEKKKNKGSSNHSIFQQRCSEKYTQFLKLLKEHFSMRLDLAKKLRITSSKPKGALYLEPYDLFKV